MSELEGHSRAVVDLIDGLGASAARRVIGIAGPPGSGKSTLADRVVRLLNAHGPRAALLPMDGFHLDNATLDARGLRATKGAPDTFDAKGFLTLVKSLRAGGDIRYPLFDRAQDCTLPDAGLLCAATPIVLVEGNYLLLQHGDWAGLATEFDARVLIAPPMAVLRDRLVARWLGHGLSPDAARARAEGNDLVNAATVLRQSAAADLVLGRAGTDLKTQ